MAWSLHDDLEELYGDPVAIWAPWVDAPITSARIDSGHHLAEENPHQLAELLTRFARANESRAVRLGRRQSHGSERNRL